MLQLRVAMLKFNKLLWLVELGAEPEEGNLQVRCFLLESGEVDMTSNKVQHHLELVRMLMKAGANKSERPRDAGATPLQMAETGWLMVASDAFDQGFRKYAACSYFLGMTSWECVLWFQWIRCCTWPLLGQLTKRRLERQRLTARLSWMTTKGICMISMLGIAGFKFVGAMIIKQRYAQQTCGFS